MIRVLIVDDEVQLIKAFKKQLTEDGMSVVTAASAGDALGIIAEQDFSTWRSSISSCPTWTVWSCSCG